jgi:asparagine synthase (glutamine-hydrolysing)
MPGIVGLITKKPRSIAEPELLCMLKAISHEAFYNTGTWVDEFLGVYMGWASMKGSFSDGMPLRNQRGDVCLVFSGEEYSNVRATYTTGNGGSSEAAYLVQRHEEDPNFIANLNGMFHGLIADRARGIVTLFNDRYGMHRLCYHASQDSFYFAGEAKAILAAQPEHRGIDQRSLGEFVACSCVLENRTIFKGIEVMPGGSTWTFRNAELESRSTYFEPRQWEEQDPLNPDTYYQELRSTLWNRLPNYFGGRQPIGISMTGGLDTRVILACHHPAPGSLPSYTFGGPYRESQDVRIGRQIAQICQQPHQIIEVSQEFLSGFANYAERSMYITEGTVDVNRASDLYVSKKAREIAPAKIVGTYGSEIVRHAVMFKAIEPMAGLFHPEFLPQVREAALTYSALRQQHPVTFAAFRQSPWYHHGVLALEQSQLSVHSPFMDNDFVRTVYRAPKDDIGIGDVRLRLIRDGNPALGRIRSDRGVGGNGGLSSAFSRAYHEFTFKAEYAYDYGMPQAVARVDHFLSALHLERLFLGRHKLLHFRVWYRDALSAYVREILLDRRALSRPYLEGKKVEALVNGHLDGGENHTSAIHKLISLELLHRLFYDAA